MNTVRHPWAVLFTLSMLAASAGCGNEEPQPESCPEGDMIAGECAGVPSGPVCSAETCADGVACDKMVTASNDAELASAVSSATAGTCIVLMPGSYSAVSLPGGVSLLGRSADDVHIDGVSLGAGDGATVRGLAVGAEGLKIDGATSAVIESVRVSGTAATGIDVAAGSSVEIAACTVEKSGRYGVTAADGASVMLDRTLITLNEGPGVWASCSAGCGCAEPPEVTVSSSILRGNRLVGMALFAAKGTLDSVDVVDTKQGDTWHYGMGGGGLSAASCSTLDAKALRVLDSALYGVLIDDSNATLGAQDMDQGIEVSGNFVGVWAQNISSSEPQTVTIENASLTDNDSVGLGVGGDAQGLIVCKSAISGTHLRAMPVEGGGPGDMIGDGLVWQGGAAIAIDGLSLSGNERASVVIDGEAGGSLANVTLSDGDEAKGIVQQNYAGGAQPALETNTPPLTTDPGQKFSVPMAPELVPQVL